MDSDENIEHAKSAKYQYLAAFVVNLLTVGFGVLEGWTSPSIALLTSDETPLASGIITMEEASWVASLLHVGVLIGNIFFGYVTNNFGRKLPLMCITIPMIICWLLIWFADNVYHLYAARLLGGFFRGSGYMIVPIFLSEIADDKVRGTLCSTLILSETSGILLAYIIGYSDIYAIPKFAIALTTFFSICLYFLPETSLFLLKQNKLNEAKHSVRFYKNVRYTEEDQRKLDYEMNKLRVTLDDMETEIVRRDSFKWSDVTTGIGRKALIIGIMLVGLNVFSGVFAMTTYTTNIFEGTGSNMSASMSTIIVGVIQLIGACFTTQFVDRCGRKLMLVISFIGSALGLIALGIYMTLKSSDIDVETFNSIPVASFSFAIFITSLGTQSITPMVVVEIMPERIKDACVSFCMTLLWLFAFINIKYIPTLIDTLGFHYTVFIFAGVCVFGALFTILIVPETKAKSHDEIMKSLQMSKIL